MTSDFEALAAGHICLDVVPLLNGPERSPFEETFLPGRLVSAGKVKFNCGGAVANTGLALHKLGIQTGLAGKVGDDLFGREILEIMRSFGEDLVSSMIVDPQADTSYSVIISYPGYDRIFIHYPGANDDFGSADVRDEDLRRTRLFHLGYPPLMHRLYRDQGAELVDLLRRARKLGVTTSLDMAFPDPASDAGRINWRDILARVLPEVDLFFPSVEEILFMLRGDLGRQSSSNEAAATDQVGISPQLLSGLGSELLDLGAKIVGLKLGDSGLYLRTADRDSLESLGCARPKDLSTWEALELWAPCFEVNVAGTTGAGDATIAGFLAALLRDLPPESALTSAVAAGAARVEASNGLDGILPWEKMWERIDTGWPRKHLELAEAGWEFVPESGIWRGALVK